jgi:hypothetical protein
MALGVKCILGLLLVLVLCEVSLGKIPRKRRSTAFHRFVRDIDEGEPGPEPEEPSSEEYYVAVDPTDPPEYTPEPWESSEEPASKAEGYVKLLSALDEGYIRRQVNPIKEGESVSVGLRYRCARFDEKEHVLTSTVWLQQTWKDPELRWNPSSYSGISEIRIHPYYVWTPDLKVYNALEGEDRGWVNAVVFSSGEVLEVPPITFKTACRPQGSDSHLCTIQIGSWTYDSSLLPLSLKEEGFWIDESTQDCPYTVSNERVHLEEKKYDYVEEVFQTINYSFTIQPNDYSRVGPRL